MKIKHVKAIVGVELTLSELEAKTLLYLFGAMNSGTVRQGIKDGYEGTKRLKELTELANGSEKWADVTNRMYDALREAFPNAITPWNG